MLHSMLLPFVVGIVLAYFIDPIVDKLEKWGASRTLATSIITAGVIFVVIIAFLILIPILHSQVADFASRIPMYCDALWEKTQPLIELAKSRLPQEDVARLTEKASMLAGETVKWLAAFLGSLLSGGMAVFSLLSLVLITPIVTFYFLRDWDKMVAKVDSWLPRDKADVIRKQFYEIDKILAGFIRGQATVCLILGVFYGIGLTLVGLDMGLIIGLCAGMISFVPYVGCIAGMTVSIGLALAQFSDISSVGMVALVFLIGQVMEGNFLTPKLVGNHVGLHPIWLIFALLAGGSLIGFLGVLIAVPVAAVIGVLVRFALSEYMKSPLYSKGISNKKKQTISRKKNDKK